MPNNSQVTSFNFLPPTLPPERIAARIGLVSDTHLPERCPGLPPAIFEVLAGVDFLLHSGDVGVLSVLDDLSRIAPVIAVHGNDDTPDSQRELPFQQVVTLAGQRILLTHGHRPNRADELAVRRNGTWQPNLAHYHERAASAGATIFISGHTHVAMALRRSELFLVNPGAIAPGNFTLRQTRRSVAILWLRDDGEPFVSHIDLDSRQSFTPQVDFNASFMHAHNAISASILTPDLASVWEAVQALVDQAPEAGRAAMSRAAYPCWSGERALMSPVDLWAEIAWEESLPAEIRAAFGEVLAG